MIILIWCAVAAAVVAGFIAIMAVAGMRLGACGGIGSGGKPPRFPDRPMRVSVNLRRTQYSVDPNKVIREICERALRDGYEVTDWQICLE